MLLPAAHRGKRLLMPLWLPVHNGHRVLAAQQLDTSALPAAYTGTVMVAAAPHVAACTAESGDAAAMHLCPLHCHQAHEVMALILVRGSMHSGSRSIWGTSANCTHTPGVSAGGPRCELQLQQGCLDGNEEHLVLIRAAQPMAALQAAGAGRCTESGGVCPTALLDCASAQ